MVSQEKLDPKDKWVHLDHLALLVREENQGLEESQDWLDHLANQADLERGVNLVNKEKEDNQG